MVGFCILPFRADEFHLGFIHLLKFQSFLIINSKFKTVNQKDIYMAKEIRPQFLKYFIPIVEALTDLGGSGTASEIIDLAIDKLGISEKEQQATIKNGKSKIRNQAQWARLYLA